MENFKLVSEELRKRAHDEEVKGNGKLAKRLNYSANVFDALDAKEVDPLALNDYLRELKSILNKSDIKPAQVTRFYTKVLSFIQKKYGYVTEKFYQNQWMAIGMAAFGMPFGIMFGFALDNMAFLGIGLPIGMPIGMAIGAQKDKQAKEKGLQLEISCDF